MTADALRDQLISFLKSAGETLPLAAGATITRREAQEQLQALIPTTIEVRDVCVGPRAIVLAAPHVSFDHWSEYFCNRAAAHLKVGRVVAKHFRDQDNLHIPVSIRRHVHVNRPTESDGPNKPEHETKRARHAHEKYIAALREAGGGKFPLALLIEFHSQRQHKQIEIATVGWTASEAESLLEMWNELRRREVSLPELRIEPLHDLHFTAASAKRHGSLRPDVSRKALHIEIPRGVRRSEELRQLANGSLLAFLDAVMQRLET